MRAHDRIPVSQRRAKILEKRDPGKTSARPPFPLKAQIELSNICNHTCAFCPMSKMTRKRKQLSSELLDKVLKEAHELGTREVGLFSGAEPFASPNLEHYIKHCKDIGYSYVYISTNGSIPTKERLKNALDAGLDSIKFSVNGGDRESYLAVHGKDHFEKVLDNIRFTSAYRAEKKLPLALAITFVDCPKNHGTLENLQTLIGDYVDEIVKYDSMNTSGQMFGYPGSPYTAPCSLPFETLHVSAEGYVRACCNDYQNYLALESLENMSLKEAFYSQRYIEFRQQHIDNKLHGTLCFNCIYNKNAKVKPLNDALHVPVDDSWFLATEKQLEPAHG